jgi:glycosyltransferase involved in cell wall biosynthesis
MKLLIIAPVPLDGQNTHFGGGVSFSYMGMENLFKEHGHEVRTLSPWHNLEPIFFKSYPGFREIAFTRFNKDKIKHNIEWADKVLLPDSNISSYVVKTAKRLNTPTIICNHTDFFKLVSTTFGNKFGLIIASILKSFLFPPLKLKIKILTKATSLYLTTTQQNKNLLHSMGLRVDGLFDNIGPKSMLFKEQDDPEEIARLRQNLIQGTRFDKIILFAGRIAEEKRIPLLFKARPQNAMLVIVGDGPISKKISRYHNPEEGITFINKMLPQESLRKLIKATDLSVSASDFETLGMSVYESWLCGKKSVVQNDGGFKDQIKDLSYGKLVDFNDSEVAKAAISEVLNDKTPIATIQALPTEKSILEYLCEVSDAPKLSKLNELIIVFLDSLVMLFATRRNTEKKKQVWHLKEVTLKVPQV